jgi:uncharacterized membrane protein YphA (DoxX/SURF4 family)
MDILMTVVRLGLGLNFVFWGLNGFFNWRAIPPSDSHISDFSEACVRTGFIMPVVKLLEIAGGSMLVIGVWPKLALILLGPLVFLITGLHLRWNRRPWGILLTVTVPYLAVLAQFGFFAQFFFAQ